MILFFLYVLVAVVVAMVFILKCKVEYKFFNDEYNNWAGRGTKRPQRNQWADLWYNGDATTAGCMLGIFWGIAIIIIPVGYLLVKAGIKLATKIENFLINQKTKKQNEKA